ncbi:hypothetical protein P7C73_g1561, partial [Tremellales sp. Uapishka_1]
MSSYQARDTSGPMDYEWTHPAGRIAQYLPDDDGPARKRLHSEINNQPPFDPFASPRPAVKFGSASSSTSLPFLFPGPSLAPCPSFPKYDPNQWASTTFGLPSSSTSRIEDVEMKFGDSPARPEPPSETQVEVGNSDPHEEEPIEEIRPFALGAVSRVRKRRQREWGRLDRRRDDSASEGEGEGEAEEHRVGRRTAEHHYNLHIPAPRMDYSEMISMLNGCTRIVFNVSLISIFLYIVVISILAINSDVNDLIREHSREILHEIALCSKEYLVNRCDPSVRTPLSEASCKAWEICMNQNPTVIGRFQVLAEVFAGAWTTFVDVMSFKTIGFTLIAFALFVYMANTALFSPRSAPAPSPHHQPPQQFLQQPYSFPAQVSGQMGSHIQGVDQGGQIAWQPEKRKQRWSFFW